MKYQIQVRRKKAFEGDFRNALLPLNQNPTFNSVFSHECSVDGYVFKI